MLQQHFLRDAFNAAFQFRQPHAAVPQLEHDDRFPLASHDVVDDFQRTGADRTDFHGSSVGEYVRSLRGAPWMTAPQGIRVPECAVPARSPMAGACARPAVGEGRAAYFLSPSSSSISAIAPMARGEVAEFKPQLRALPDTVTVDAGGKRFILHFFS